MAYVGQRKLFQVEFGGFLQVGNGLFDCRTLADGADFRALGNVESAFPVQDCGKRVHWHTAVL